MAQETSNCSTDAVPRRIILTFAGDPARSQAVTWRTASVAQTAKVQYARLSAAPSFDGTAVTVPATITQDDLGEGKAAGHYGANMTGLEPATSYCYRVGDGSNWSEWNIFRTASVSAEPFRFLYVGDAQNSIKSMWSRTIRAAYAAVPDARFIAHAGDLLAEGYQDKLWGEWSDAMGFISATVPSIPVPGNHDLHRPPTAANPKQVLSVSPLWRSHFLLPANGPEIPETPSQSYSVDYQGVRLIALDVNVFADEAFDPAAKQRVAETELRWLEGVLKNNPNHWTIVIQHQGIYAISKGREYKEMREALAPLYERYGVDLVLQGHDHTYARTHKVAQDKVVEPSAPGVIYAISVSGPKMYEKQEANSQYMAKIIEQKQMFQSIEVSNERLRFNAYSIDGVLADSFELRKQGSKSTYVNLNPEGTPTR
jgi:hypothetical protein